MRRFSPGLALAALWLALPPSAALAAPPPELKAYVQKPDPTFTWKQIESIDTPEGKVYALWLTSQGWQGITWNHHLRVYEPKEYATRDAMLLFITGGSTRSQPGASDAAQGLALARTCGARCAVLHQVPNQPLLEGKSEDTLIAETFVRYLDTKDANWPLLFPMVKSAVRAMDALQAFAKQGGGEPVTKFVVSGASKRGWTTWLTGAVDPRVVAIAPMVIPTLNMREQNHHQLDVWGKYSEQIADYTSRGLTEKIDTPDGSKLWHMIDPYSYRDDLTMPKLIINGTNDRYWTLDSLNLFWDELKGPKWVVYLPNAGHSLQENRDYAINGVGALFRHVISGRPMPKPGWEYTVTDGGTPRLSITSSPPAKEVKIWATTAATMDYRESRWVEVQTRQNVESMQYTGAMPEAGYAAMFGDLTYEIDGIEYHLSTQIRPYGRKAEK
jgi:PhoPQ-activated pathogenicity-related protein